VRQQTTDEPKRPRRITEWRKRTRAEVLDAGQFYVLKARSELYIVGVMGFAGRWERSGLEGEELARFVADAREALGAELSRFRERHGGRLVVATGATNTGVLQLTYELCAGAGVPTLSAAPDASLKYELGPLRYVIPAGREFGDESDLFVSLCDEFVLLGGGKQSRRETLAASSAGKPVTVIQGFGGAADELTSAESPGARFV